MRGGATRTAIACAVALALSILCAELATRWLGLLDRVSPLPRELFRPGDSPELSYRLRSGADVRIGDVRVRVNRLGLRGPEVDAAPPEGARRLLVLGDSVAYGHMLPESESFPARLEAELRRRGERVEVLNGAAPGYDTRAELAFLREVGLALSPHALILAVSLNDFGPAPALTPLGFLVDRQAREELPSSWLDDHSELLALVRWIAAYPGKERWSRGLSGAGDAEANWRALDRYVGVMHKRFYAEPSGPAWDELRRSLRDLRDLASERGVDLALVIFPELDQVGVPEPNLDPQRRWMALCRQLALHCLDLWPAFAEKAARSDEVLFLDTQHPSAVGVRLSAHAVSEFLAR